MHAGTQRAITDLIRTCPQANALTISDCVHGQAIPLVDQGVNTFDPNTGLRWLDVTISQNRSYSDVSANFGVGGDFDGYRYATGVEVTQLFANAAITSPYAGAQNGEAPAIAALIALLGATYADPNVIYTYGITADDHPSYPPGTLNPQAKNRYSVTAATLATKRPQSIPSMMSPRIDRRSLFAGCLPVNKWNSHSCLSKCGKVSGALLTTNRRLA